MAKNIVILSDGTGNEPKLKGNTNVMRLFDMLPQTDEQVVWYDPGVGTRGSAKALTPIGRGATKVAGLAFGYGLKENVSQAYTHLMDTYEDGDRIFLFGFSRGAYTARAIAGLLYQVGLLRKGQENLLPYALKLFWWNADKKSKENWKEADHFSKQFARPDFRRRNLRKVHYVGVWDTVKAAGFLRRTIVLPWTAKMEIAAALRHAVSIDEKRRPFKANLLAQDPKTRANEAFHEVWFAGVHSDVGGTFDPDHCLADIALEWIVAGAIENDLIVDPKAFKKYVDQPASNSEGKIHDMGWKWWLTTVFNHRTIVPDDATIHESVRVRMDRLGYKPPLPTEAGWEPWAHQP